MTAALPEFRSARVLVVGDSMLDRYWTGPTQRISPEAPVPVVRIRRDETRPGGAANVALNLAGLGVQVHLIGVIGSDEAGEQLAQAVSQRGITADWVRTAEHPTITKLRVLSRNQQLIRLDFEESLDELGAFDRVALQQCYQQRLAECDLVVLSDYGKGTLADAAGLIAAARAAGKPVLVDPKGHDYARYTGATLLTPNVPELEAVSGPCTDDTTLERHAQSLCSTLGLEAVLVTRSERGMSLFRSDDAPLHLPALAREVFDVTGAGDTVIATLAAALAANAPLTEACRLANIAAGIVVGKLGTATVSVLELEAALHAEHGDSAVLDEPALLQQITAARAAGRRIVMTNGCFDILHVGHVRYLEAAQRLGDLLIVAVNDDASVSRLKGPTRPLNACEDRMRVLAGLRSVDYVVPFSEDTPARLIAAVLPDVLVKGGDYRPEQIAGHEVVTANGGEVVVLDFHQGYSTTSLIQRAAGPAA
ncbi:bifunctional D-glycero-beta-D-manno-heptose-7-phosphate kinase/D-glycero-beta-D-manno-heptose 1-phosphate adenylyltransferase HldE [Sinimarinibacterium sp. CAU 1509]|uniref:bifunctional D-glycero-beta-D-manno-heptose-7-phosphate kinase/D-glycero-beta-D-manno-heptose 1-phosphate adenylyltransferase HldE n=1 Tax=Sinimarinibacterium sp. CAU 1509 TaxID=2562283 RepID=UPI0010ABE6C9|nr:bifunctional D-glycero-beta-D-manno-heptose-7-phosphate kinase/D-glycero-beta-D-manno-heptose 1-phosphate adenylyltransferase HldE [Sinimarinibacterium sp. CAU 1509]TJY59324.1 bifunctional D-glycero-beta-D-manno-heptose-7-phosphate kinase/D-glycero-beta-D-manno-heptose 1-phosphate adenylyltransferase HldE [Sinimarinibacterium sp. CAU 1509]